MPAHPAPRLLYFVNIPRFFVSHRMPLALAAREAGFDVHAAASGDDAENIAVIRAAGFPFHPLPLRQHGLRPWQEAAALLAVYRLYRQLRPDIVHHVTIKAVIYGGLAARLARVPAVVNAVTGLGYIYSEPGLKARLVRTLALPAYRLALGYGRSRMIFQNPDDQEMFVKNRLIAPGKTQVIKGSGVDTSQFAPRPETGETPVVLFAGRLLWKKGIGEFVEVAQQLQQAGIAARFVVVGYSEPGSPAAVPESILRNWQSSGWIEWWGKRTDMPEVYAQAHIVCLPSSYGEGVPKVLIEAAACGRATVTTDTPGCREITRQGENGLLVPPGDTAALAQAVHTLIADADLRRRMGARGRQIAEAGFSLDQVVRETVAIYRTLMDQSQAGQHE